MSDEARAYYERLRATGLAPDREERILAELSTAGERAIPETPPDIGGAGIGAPSLYDHHDLVALQEIPPPRTSAAAYLRSLDELLERDRAREADGFPRKIRVGRLIKPGKGGKDNVVVVPTTVEEKLLHDRSFSPSEEQAGGAGDGEEGEVIGEQPVREDPGAGAGGQGEGGPHEMESSAYDLGRILTEKFELPNLKDKGKKRSLTRYTHDLTDRHRGFGQFLDKKATLRRIVETNVALGRLTDPSSIDPTDFLVAPNDEIYRILSKERDFESQALVFFVRDYSGSMSGKPTDLVVTQHVLIYSWLTYQYARQVESRFVLHDTAAVEVPDFHTYYNSKVAGGTKVASAFALVNEIVEKEGLVHDYNIYVFYGTDGEDWDSEGKEAVAEIEKMLGYANRVGVSIVQREEGSENATEVGRYLTGSGLPERHPDLLRLDTLGQEADEPRLIEGIKRLIS